jgi:hypothetical protein
MSQIQTEYFCSYHFISSHLDRNTILLRQVLQTLIELINQLLLVTYLFFW